MHLTKNLYTKDEYYSLRTDNVWWIDSMINFLPKDFSSMVEADYNWVTAKKYLHWVRIQNVSYHSTPSHMDLYICVYVFGCGFALKWCLKCFSYVLGNVFEKQSMLGFILKWLPVLSIWGLSFIYGTLS